MVVARMLAKQVARAFNDAGADYAATGASFLPHFTELLLDRAAFQPGQRIVDVATGPGTVALQAPPHVAPGGEVVGVDAAEVQLRLARGAAAETAGTLRFLHADAARLDFADHSVDTVLCGFGLPYMEEPVQVVREAGRILRPGGCLLATVWADPFLAPLGERLQATLERFEAPLVHRPFGEAPATIAQWLLRAEFNEIEIEDHTLEVALPTFDAWWQLARAFAFLLRFDIVAAEKQEAILDAHREELAALSDGLTMAVRVYLARGRR